MRVFNRLFMALLFAAIVALGVFGVLYSFRLAGYQPQELPNTLGLSAFYESLQGLVGNIEGGSVGALAVAILVAVAVVGVILLVAELKPPKPRLVRMQQGTYITRAAVREQVLAATDRVSETVDSVAKVKSRRRPGAKVKLKAWVRRGEDVKAAKSNIRSQVAEQLSQAGVPVSRMKLKVKESSGQGARKRVS